jgi:hypothetical protein
MVPAGARYMRARRGKPCVVNLGDMNCLPNSVSAGDSLPDDVIFVPPNLPSVGIALDGAIVARTVNLRIERDGSEIASETFTLSFTLVRSRTAKAAGSASKRARR